MSTDTELMSGTYVADPIHSSFRFAVQTLGVSTFRGTLGTAAATLDFGPDGPTLVGAAEVDSISIREPEQFRAHVLGGEFFAADANPLITFQSDRVDLAPDGIARVAGQLTVKGITLPLRASGSWSPPIDGPMGHHRSHLALEARINRRDFGLDWDSTLPDGSSGLGDEVTITLDLALVSTD